MAFRGGDSAFSAAATAIANATATVVLTIGPVEVPSDSIRCIIFGLVTITTGAATSSLVTRIHRGTTIADPVVGSLSQSFSNAGVGNTGVVFVTDVLANVATVTYTLSVQQGGGTGPGTASWAQLAVMFV